MTEPKLEDIQAKVIDILRNFHDFCEANNIDYYIIGGTLIGAVRHGGIIPWDDDIDVGVPRESYERLMAIGDKIQKPLLLSSYNSDKEYIYSFIKCYDTSTKVTELLNKPFTRGLWIDVFPLDGTFENKFLRGGHYGCLRFLKTLFATKMNAYKPEREYGLSKILRYLMRFLSFFISSDAIQNTLQKVLKIHPYSNSRNVGNLLGRWGYKEVVDKKIFEEKRLFDFSGISVYGPKGYHEYLMSIYGDYMQLPSIKMQVPDHNLDHIQL